MHHARAEFRAVRQSFQYDVRLFAIGVGHEGIRMGMILERMDKHRHASKFMDSLPLPGAGIAIHGNL